MPPSHVECERVKYEAKRVEKPPWYLSDKNKGNQSSGVQYKH